MKKPKVMIAIPTYYGKEYCLAEMIELLRKLTYSNFEVVFCESSFGPAFYERIKKDMPEATVLKSDFIPSPKENLVQCRNKLRDYFLKNDYDYFFSLEADNFPPTDIIEKLLKHKKLVVGAWYDCMVRTRLGKNMPLACINMTSMKASKFRNFDGFFDDTSLCKVFLIGLGCVLIKKEVLEKIEFSIKREFYQNSNVSKYWYDDVWFVIDCEEKGIDVFCDRSIKCRHDSEKALDTREIDVWGRR